MKKHNLLDDLPGFDDPVAMLRACHDRILAQCDVLEKVLERLATGECDDETKNAVAGVVRYFSTAGKLHHRDEEEDVFPRISRQSGRMAELVQGLEKEHVILDALWADLEPALAGLPDSNDAVFRKTVNDFCTLMRGHVQRENGEILPLVSGSLGRPELEEIGRAMAERRGVHS